MKNTIIIDFNGSVSAGKTTIAKALAALLEKRGFSVLDYFNKSEKARPLSAFFSTFFLMRLCVWRLFFYYVRFAFRLAPVSRELLQYCFIAYKMFAVANYHYRRREVDIFIFDQGLLQNLVAVTYNETSPRPLPPDSPQVKKITAGLLRCFNGFLFVNTEIPTETALERIAARTHGGGPLDRLSHEKRAYLMNTLAKSYESIRAAGTRAAGVTIDARCSPEENAAAILAHLEARGQL